MNACKIIAVANQKGGVAKSTTSYNFAACLSEAGKRVLLVDLDPQASLTILYGIDQPDELEFTICDLMKACAEDKEMAAEACILHEHTVDLIPSSIELSTLEISLVGVMSREHILKQVLAPLRSRYDYIIIDCPPSLGLLTINALTACDRVLITTTPQFFSTKGLELLIDSIRSFNSPDPPVSRTSGTGGRCQAPRLCGSPHHLPASRYPVAPLSPNHPGRL